MGSVSELGLELKLPMEMGSVLREAWAIGDEKLRLSRLEELMNGLEEESRKIHAFKRELPLSMGLLIDAIEVLKEEVNRCRSKPVLEEFMPIKKDESEVERGVNLDGDSAENKKNWMSSAQLWSDFVSTESERDKSVESKEIPDESGPMVGIKYSADGGAFVPFKGLPAKEEKVVVAAAAAPSPDLCLMSKTGPRPSLAVDRGSCVLNLKMVGAGSGGCAGSSPVVAPPQSNGLQQQQPPRKARRCWSMDLHRQFVHALQRLGGPQVATPKQIREVMKVDGLTNDEVKSHLQKYRLHFRKIASSSTAADQPLMMLESIWVDQYHQLQKPTISQSSSPQGPLHMAGSAQVSITGGDSCEDEDGKSESSTWKGHQQRSSDGEETE
ncbi:Two-component response regulator ARR18 [Acorus calamus]|uniref:Two-component response regulator ARR18 n=1 Tax=Acorus calamus TaxID=4465 RepID=A0AAV9CT53_ACOCL|nr:Two-component response regulator ARR18 [Acorus calamus]